MIYLQLAGRVLLALARVAIVAAALGSSVRTVILPRASVSFQHPGSVPGGAQFYEIGIGCRTSYERARMAWRRYGPVAMLLLLATWISLMVIGFQLMFWAVGNGPFASFQASGSSVLTLGFSAAHRLPNTLLVLVEGSIGLVQLGPLICYLPTM